MMEFSYSTSFKTRTGKITISGGPFPTLGECLAAKWRALDAFGYEEPKWWEFWRSEEPRRSIDFPDETPV